MSFDECCAAGHHKSWIRTAECCRLIEPLGFQTRACSPCSIAVSLCKKGVQNPNQPRKHEKPKDPWPFISDIYSDCISSHWWELNFRLWHDWLIGGRGKDQDPCLANYGVQTMVTATGVKHLHIRLSVKSFYVSYQTCIPHPTDAGEGHQQHIM